MALHDSRDDKHVYLEVELATSEAFRFSTWGEPAKTQLHDIVAALPVRPFYRDPTGTDSWESVELVGALEVVFQHLSVLIERDHHTNATELGHFTNCETIVTDSNFRPDALHIVTRLWSKDGSRGSILYGARLQRVEPATFVLWSDY